MNKPLVLVLPNTTPEQFVDWLEYTAGWIGRDFTGAPYAEGEFEVAVLRPRQVTTQRSGEPGRGATMYAMEVTYLIDPYPFSQDEVTRRAENVISIRFEQRHATTLHVTIELNSTEPVAADLRLDLLLRLNGRWRGSVPPSALAELVDGASAP